MSPRAAWRLEQLGFDSSIDYAGGKMDWLSFDLPWEGSAWLVSNELDRTAPTCTIGENVRDVRGRFSQSDLCVVLFDDGVVAGALGRNAMRVQDDQPVERVMHEGP